MSFLRSLVEVVENLTTPYYTHNKPTNIKYNINKESLLSDVLRNNYGSINVNGSYLAIKDRDVDGVSNRLLDGGCNVIDFDGYSVIVDNGTLWLNDRLMSKHGLSKGEKARVKNGITHYKVC